MNNLDRGILYALLDIRYMMILGNETPGSLSYENNSFILKGNLLYTFSTKSKRVTRSVLVSEIYNIVSGVNIIIAVNSTIKKIIKQMGFLVTQIIIYTDSFLLYECLRREIAEIRWINRENNLADAVIKGSLNSSLKTFLDENQIIVRV
ncbi:hypothetical protein DL98DRAFT_626536 [Cadophora sp. DSE1049]|nr:hypothetical protein DL98DRAFT_626536 [Cadophora sp. DSE1049]